MDKSRYPNSLLKKKHSLKYENILFFLCLVKFDFDELLVFLRMEPLESVVFFEMMFKTMSFLRCFSAVCGRNFCEILMKYLSFSKVAGYESAFLGIMNYLIGIFQGL